MTPVGDEVVDDARDRAAAHAHHAGQVGAGNGLMCADQVQHNAAVDLARGTPRGDAKMSCAFH
jgi:hypothetical protein